MELWFEHLKKGEPTILDYLSVEYLKERDDNSKKERFRNLVEFAHEWTDEAKEKIFSHVQARLDADSEYGDMAALILLILIASGSKAEKEKAMRMFHQIDFANIPQPERLGSPILDCLDALDKEASAGSSAIDFLDKESESETSDSAKDDRMETLEKAKAGDIAAQERLLEFANERMRVGDKDAIVLAGLIYKELANAGVVEAQLAFAQLYTVLGSKDEAIKWYTKATKAGNKLAALELSELLLERHERMKQNSVKIHFTKWGIQMVNTWCKIFDKNGKLLKECRQGDTVELSIDKPMQITIKMGGQFGAPTEIVNPGEHYNIKYRGLGFLGFYLKKGWPEQVDDARASAGKGKVILSYVLAIITVFTMFVSPMAAIILAVIGFILARKASKDGSEFATTLVKLWVFVFAAIVFFAFLSNSF